MAELRDYQQRTIDDLYQWFTRHDKGNPCLVLPTGAGKSWIVAALCRDALQSWPQTRILVLSHVKEILEQDAEKMRAVWPGAPMGIYSAGIGRRDLGEPITFASIQSIRKIAARVGHVDLCIVDECHLISHKAEGGYRDFLEELAEINPALRVVGLTATPYRLGHGLITDEPALFHDLIEPVSIEELVYKGHLAPLRSKVTQEKLSTDGLHKRGGEYIEKEMQIAFDTEDHNRAVADEVISLAGDRKAWLFFCAGVEHAEHICDALQAKGIPAECVTGKTPKGERERILADFKAGKLRALTNANVLTTGFDYPDIDLIAMLRATMSPGLYVQMAGRGLRPKSHTDHCLVLDFAGAVEKHGPITAVQPPKKAGQGDPPVKACPECDEIVPLAEMVCPACGHIFESAEPWTASEPLRLRNDDIMGLDTPRMKLTGWAWREHVSQRSGKEMLRVTYYGALSDPPVNEYLTVTHDGFAGQKALRTLATIACWSGATEAMEAETLAQAADILTHATPPTEIEYKKDGAFYRVLRRSWNEAPAA